jgi:hypothetical protein
VTKMGSEAGWFLSFVLNYEHIGGYAPKALLALSQVMAIPALTRASLREMLVDGDSLLCRPLPRVRQRMLVSTLAHCLLSWKCCRGSLYTPDYGYCTRYIATIPLMFMPVAALAARGAASGHRC